MMNRCGRTGLMMSLMAVVFGLSSCVTTKNAGGGLFGPRKENRSAVYLAALQGGIVSRSGASLSKGETQRALEAEYRALETSPSGQAVTWEDDDVSGKVVAAAPYQVGNQNCRQYTHGVSVKARTFEAKGAACRNEDGTWTPLN
nr:membrane protein [Allorhizobium undicola]